MFGGEGLTTGDSASSGTECISFEDFLKTEGNTRLLVPVAEPEQTGRKLKRKRRNGEISAVTKTAAKKSKLSANATASDEDEPENCMPSNTHSHGIFDTRHTCKKAGNKDHTKVTKGRSKKRKPTTKRMQTLIHKTISDPSSSDMSDRDKNFAGVNVWPRKCDASNMPRRASEDEKKRRKSSSDGVVFVSEVRKATHSHLAASMSRSMNKPKKVMDDLPPLKNECILWIDKHSPQTSKALMGNSSTVTKLYAWLLEWKRKIIKEKEQLSRQAAGSETPKGHGADDDDSSSDFEDCEKRPRDIEEDDSVRTTGIVIGPTGSGKTAAVYTCAAELGFKVFEMNASSQRSSKQVLSQLQEATQSHLVSKKRDLPKCPFSRQDRNTTGKQHKNIPKLFERNERKKKISSVNGDVIVCDDPVTENGEVHDGGGEEKMSLILFEDAEVVFEDDKSFWSAVQTLMTETKRPIIIVATKPTILSNLEGKYEKFAFKLPTPIQLSTALESIGKVEGCLDIDSAQMDLLARTMRCDIRKSIHTMQFWSSSNYAATTQRQGNQNGIEILPQKTCRHQGFKKNTTGIDAQSDTEGERGRANTYLRHCDSGDIFSRITGISDVVRQLETTASRTLFDLLQLSSLVSDSKILECLENCLAHLHLHCLPQVVMLNWQSLLKQPKPNKANSIVSPACRLPINVPESSLTWSANMDVSAKSFPLDKLFSTEGMDFVQQDFLDMHNVSPPRLTEEKSTSKTSLEQKTLNGEESESSKGSVLKTMKLLSIFAEFCASADLLHCTFKSSDVFKSDDDTTCTIQDGLLDTFGHHQEISYKTETVISDFKASYLSRSLAYCARQLKSVMDASEFMSSPHPANISLSHPCEGEFKLSCQELRQSVQSSLLGGDITASRHFVLDYLPSLRMICRSEARRKEAKVRRRFLHYLDSVNMHLKPTELLCLQHDFEEKVGKVKSLC